MAQLLDLLTDEEIKEVKSKLHMPGLSRDVREITVNELSSIALTLMQTEYPGQPVKDTILAAEAITILTKRAISKGISIY